MLSNLTVGLQCTSGCFLVSFFHIKIIFFFLQHSWLVLLLHSHHKVVFIAIIHMDFKYLMKSTGCAWEWKWNRPDRVHANEMENKVLIHHLLYNRYTFQPYFHRHVTCDSCNVRFYFSRCFFFFFILSLSLSLLPSSPSIWYHSATFCPLRIALYKWNFIVAHHFSLFIPLCARCVCVFFISILLFFFMIIAIIQFSAVCWYATISFIRNWNIYALRTVKHVYFVSAIDSVCLQ